MKAVAAAGLLALLIATEARAIEPARMPARVILRRSGCESPAFDEADFVRLLRIELAADGVTEVDTAGPGEALPSGPALAVLSLEGACAGDAVVTFEIDDAATDKKVRRVVDLRDLPGAARARALSLAAAELMRASWAELALPGVPRPRAPVPPEVREAAGARLAASPLVAAAPPAARAMPLLIFAGLDARYFFGSRSAVLGARLAASSPLVGPLRLRADAGAAYGRTSDPLGGIDLWMVTAAVGPSLGRAWEHGSAELGPRVELGWGSARGLPAHAGIEGQRASTLLVITTLAATSRLRLGTRFWATLDGEVGPVVHALTALVNTRASSGFGGAMVGARLGLAVGL